MEKIGKIRLENQGRFVTRIQFVIEYDGRRIKSYQSDDILSGQLRTMSPGELGVPNEAIITLYIYVMAGKDRESEEKFIFDDKSDAVAKYKISGTTRISKVCYEGIDRDGCNML